jgi:hypothetical protein
MFIFLRRNSWCAKNTFLKITGSLTMRLYWYIKIYSSQMQIRGSVLRMLTFTFSEVPSFHIVLSPAQIILIYQLNSSVFGV